MPSVLKKKRIEEIDILRGFAICMVILGHSIIEFPVDVSAVPWCSWLHHFIYSFHMALFFLLSGFVYRCRDYKKFILNKSGRILVPYVIFNAFSIVLHIVASSSVNGGSPPKQMIIDAALYGGEYWFLYTLFIIFAIFPLLEKLFSKQWMWIAFSAVLIIIQCFVKIPAILTLNSIIYYLPWFAAGYICQKNTDVIKKVLSKKPAVFSASAVLAVLLLIVYKKTLSQFVLLRYSRAFFFIVIFALAANVIAKKSADLKILKSIKLFLNKCSKFSLQFYLFNGYFLTVLRTVLCRKLGLGVNDAFVIVLVITVVTLVGSIIACEILQRIPFVSQLCGMTYIGKNKRKD